MNYKARPNVRKPVNETPVQAVENRTSTEDGQNRVLETTTTTAVANQPVANQDQIAFAEALTDRKNGNTASRKYIKLGATGLGILAVFTLVSKQLDGKDGFIFSGEGWTPKVATVKPPTKVLKELEIAPKKHDTPAKSPETVAKKPGTPAQSLAIVQKHFAQKLGPVAKSAPAAVEEDDPVAAIINARQKLTAHRTPVNYTPATTKNYNAVTRAGSNGAFAAGLAEIINQAKIETKPGATIQDDKATPRVSVAQFAQQLSAKIRQSMNYSLEITDGTLAMVAWYKLDEKTKLFMENSEEARNAKGSAKLDLLYAKAGDLEPAIKDVYRLEGAKRTLIATLYRGENGNKQLVHYDADETIKIVALTVNGKQQVFDLMDKGLPQASLEEVQKLSTDFFIDQPIPSDLTLVLE